MFELLEVWRYSRGNEADFRGRVRIYALDDARARTPIERIRLAANWKRQHDEIADQGTWRQYCRYQGFRAVQADGAFYRDVPDILATMFDTVQPRSFEELGAVRVRQRSRFRPTARDLNLLDDIYTNGIC
jgi:hypothetical protein